MARTKRRRAPHPVPRTAPEPVPGQVELPGLPQPWDSSKCACWPRDLRGCHHCRACDTCGDCGRCAGQGCACACED